MNTDIVFYKIFGVLHLPGTTTLNLPPRKPVPKLSSVTLKPSNRYLDSIIRGYKSFTKSNKKVIFITEKLHKLQIVIPKDNRREEENSRDG